MAETPSPFPLSSYQTALCIVPPEHRSKNIDRLRSLYDQAYGRWPAHVNLVYPFVPVNRLPQAAERIRKQLASLDRDSNASFAIRLNEANCFSQRQGKTIHLAPEDHQRAQEEERHSGLHVIRNNVLKSLGQQQQQEDLDAKRQYAPHLTIGQTKTHDPEARDYLLAKARLLLPVEWEANELVVLVREYTSNQESSPSRMRVYATVDLAGNRITVNDKNYSSLGEAECSALADMQITSPRTRGSGQVDEIEQRSTYTFDPNGDFWKPVSKPSSNPYDEEMMPSTFTVSSYNVLVDPSHRTPARYPVLVQNILSESALADVLVLQEVSDDFLSYLLAHYDIQETYPFATHGPPEQEGLGPLPSLVNIVVLSRWNFRWSWVPFEARHKGSVVLEMDSIGKYDDSDNFIPLVLTGVHLSSGISDKSVLMKKSQLEDLLGFLSKNYPDNPYIIAGDFNIATSMFSIEESLRQQLITPQSYDAQLALESFLWEEQLSDAWHVARTEMGGTIEFHSESPGSVELHQGEQGATFDPTVNPLALESVRTGFGRPQRYDRILAKEREFLSVSNFNMFGFPNGLPTEPGSAAENVGVKFGSDHWGIRATFRFVDDAEEEDTDNAALQQAVPPLQKAPVNLASTESLASCLAEAKVYPSDEESQKRKDAFCLVKNLLVYGSASGAEESEEPSGKMVSTVVVPVGSYGLGVWDSSSDVDCLCLSSISSKTFFTLAIRRFNRAAHLGIRILRKVIAASGTMLEIDVGDIKLDIQYCPAARIVERWPEVSRLPAGDPLFDAPFHSLTKLQPFRDLNYIQRTVPDLATFRTAHRFIKAWAKQRGIYAAKFGYLGGIHIAMMLSRLCKLYSRDAAFITAADIICTFFKYYARFDWDNELLYDPVFFKGKKPRYRRYVNEPMVILTIHAPIINVARAISIPSRRTIVEELDRADRLLSGDDPTWSTVISGTGEQGDTRGAHEFLKAYNSYVKINIQYWGLSLAKGSALVGWLESRCLRLLVDLDRKLPDIHTRIWPARFTLKDADSSSATGDREYQGCYLIGLTRADKTAQTEPMTKEERRQARDSLQTALDRFTSQIHEEKEYFDPSLCWIDAAQVKQSDLGDLTVDKREWGDYIVPDEVDDEEDDDCDEENEDMIDPETEEGLTSTATTAKTKGSKPKGGIGRRLLKPVINPGPKLRPASDILNRLRWDASFDAADYVIGYEDRFLGAKETSLEHWKGEQTDEEFIPLHRILYFRRRADGGIVWDRRTRRDEIFGSGIASSG